MVLAEVRDSPLSVDEVVAAVRHPAAGAVVTFIGYVRERDHGEAVEVLDYTSHPTAEQVARELTDRLAAEGRVIRIGVVRRTGHLTIGEIAVVAAVSAATAARRSRMRGWSTSSRPPCRSGSTRPSPTGPTSGWGCREADRFDPPGTTVLDPPSRRRRT